METSNDDPLVLDDDYARECHQRWIQRMNRRDPSPDAGELEEGVEGQCGMCRFYMPLRGALGTDWGVCSNRSSSRDGTAMFEHDGCDEYSGASEWVTTFLYFQSKKRQKQ
jgi:hypothetical protein